MSEKKSVNAITLPVVWPCRQKYARISSSLAAPALSILLPRIKTGQLANCSSDNKLY